MSTGLLLLGLGAGLLPVGVSFPDPPPPIGTSAEISRNGRYLVVQIPMDQPSNWGVMDWVLGAIAGKGCSLSSGATLAFKTCTYHSNVPETLNATYDHASKTVNSTGSFANYVFGDTNDEYPVAVANGGGAVNLQKISSRVSDDAITLVTSLGASTTSCSALPMPAGQGSKLVWRIVFRVEGANSIALDASGLTFTAQAGVFQDVYGNSNEAITNLAVTNNSWMGENDFAWDFESDTDGVIVYLAPGAAVADDSHTLIQAQNPDTPFATLARAISAGLSTQAGKGYIIKWLSGTTDTDGVAFNYSGSSRHPIVVKRFWDARYGVGTNGARWKADRSDGSDWKVNDGASNILIEGGEFFGDNNHNGQPNLLSGGGATMFTDCKFRNLPTGVRLEYVDPDLVTLNRIDAHRCIFADCWTGNGVHTQGMFSDRVSNLYTCDTVFHHCGGKTATGNGSDRFSRSIYNGACGGPVINDRLFISQSDGIQCRPGGSITNVVHTRVHLINFVGQAGGRIARCYTELGANFSTRTFSGATYTHSSRTVSCTGIGATAPGIPSWISAFSGTGIVTTTLTSAKIASITNANTIVLSGNGLGAGADGSSNIAGMVHETGDLAGQGANTQSTGQYISCGPQLIEMILGNRLNTYGGDPLTALISARDASYRAVRHAIQRNVQSYQSGAEILAGTEASPNPTRVDRQQNLLDNRGTTLVSERATTGFQTTGVHSDYNVLLSDGNAITVSSVAKTLAEFQSLSGGEAHSSTTATPTYVDNTATLDAWAVECGIGTTVADLVDALVNRLPGTWPACADMSDCADFMLSKYVPSVLGAVGTAPLNFYGAGASDPAVYLGA